MWRDGESQVGSGTRTSAGITAVGRATAESLAPDHGADRGRMTSLHSQGSLGEPLAKLDQGLGPCWVCHERSGRLTWRLPPGPAVKGGSNIPVTHDGCSHLAQLRVGQVSAGRRCHALGQLRFCCPLTWLSPLSQGRSSWFISGSNKAPTTVPLLIWDGRPFVETANPYSTRMVRLRDGWRPF